MSLSSPIDLYCERTAPGLWAEPINVLSNASFLIAAYALWLLYRKAGKKDVEILLLIALTMLVGLGSLSFHTFANRWSMLSDVIPITLFIFCYLWVAIRRVFAVRNAPTLLILALFFGFSSLLDYAPANMQLNGSLGYFPSLGAILAFTLLTSRSSPPLSTHYAITFSCFALSIALRSIDMMYCAYFGLGTHFMWHILNGVVLYRLCSALLHFPLRGQVNRVD